MSSHCRFCESDFVSGHACRTEAERDKCGEWTAPVPRCQPSIAERLRSLCSPDAEMLSDYSRINAFCRIGHEAADRIEALEVALKKIEAIEDQSWGEDWCEINEAREIARAALEAK